MTGGSPSPYPLLRSQPLYDGRVVSLRRDTVRMSDGALAEREVVQHPGAVGIVALDEQERVLLVNQYRHPVGERLDELPAGLLDVEGESALLAAQRELAEETGTRARSWHVLLDLHTSPGMTDEAIRIYLARGLSPVPEDERFHPADEELTMTVERVPLAGAVQQALAGRMTNAAAVAGVLAAAVGAGNGWASLRPADAAWPARPGR